MQSVESRLSEELSANSSNLQEKKSHKKIRKRRKQRKESRLVKFQAEEMLMQCTRNERKFIKKLSSYSNQKKWLCSCGKRYSCYPSLNYHIKKKHPNEKVQYVRPVHVKKKGRPKKIQPVSNSKSDLTQLSSQIFSNFELDFEYLLTFIAHSNLELDIKVQIEQILLEFFYFAIGQTEKVLVWFWIYYMKESVDSYQEFSAFWFIDGRSFCKMKPILIQLWRRRREVLVMPVRILEKVFEIFQRFLEEKGKNKGIKEEKKL